MGATGRILSLRVRVVKKMDEQKWILPFIATDSAHFPDGEWKTAVSNDSLHAFTIGKGDERWGWTAVYPIPGLDGIYAIDGFMQPGKRRRGAGSQLLHHLAGVMASGQLSYAIETEECAAAHFFRANNFYVEHEEWGLVHDNKLQRPTHIITKKAPIQTIPTRITAIQQFLRLYDAIFSPHRWYQPFTAAEVEQLLEDEADLLFLMDGGQAIGFAWLRMEDGVGEIEPIGVLAAYQGMGNGRFLLQYALKRLYERGATQVKIGVWRENETAVLLYQSVGFHHRETLTYYALDL